MLLQAFTLLRERVPHATLVVAGATRRQLLETDRNGSGLPVDISGVEALGWVADEEKVARACSRLSPAETPAAPTQSRHEAVSRELLDSQISTKVR